MKLIKGLVTLGVLVVVMSFSLVGKAQELPAYLIFDKEGKKVDFGEMTTSLLKNEVLLFGELHNNPIAHWLELEVLKAAFAKKGEDLVLGAEMFEADNQLLLTEYLLDQISEKNFEKEVKNWPNYETDYKPLVAFAKNNYLGFIATNIPRRYASIVFQEGLDALGNLSDRAKEYIAPLPIPLDLELPGYKAMMEMMGDHNDPNFPSAQAIKDATMAHFITQYKPKKGLFLHFNGSYHSDNWEGIAWYLKQYNKKIKIGTISTVEQDDIKTLSPENLGKADFTICVPSEMTKTY